MSSKVNPNVSGFLLVIFGYFVIPETFGLTLEDIEEHYRDLYQNTNVKKQGQSAQNGCQELKP